VFRIELTNDQSQLPLDTARLTKAARMVLEDAELDRAEISIAVVDDPTIRRLHQEYLEIDEPTDVMSFVLEQEDGALEGEVVVSADTARSAAEGYGWPAADELLLYVLHGTLHLVGYDDTTPELRIQMRRQEKQYLARFGLEAPRDDSPADAPASPTVGQLPADGGERTS